jgi:hypothetical protein
MNFAPQLKTLGLVILACSIVAIGYFGLLNFGLNWLTRNYLSQPYGFIDPKGTVRINVNTSPGSNYPYEVAGKYCCGQCLIKDVSSGRFNFIDKNGKLLCEQPLYSHATAFSEGLAGVSLAQNSPEYAAVYGMPYEPLKPVRWHFIDMLGHKAFDADLAAVEKFSQGLCAVRKPGSGFWNYIDKKGDVAFNGNFDTADEFSEGRASVCKRSRWGVIDQSGNWIVSPHFSQRISRYSEGLATVEMAETHERVYLNKDGKVVLRFPGPDQNKPLQHAQVVDGNFVIKSASERCFAIPASNFLPAEGLITYKKGDLCGYSDLNGKEIIKPQFDYCWPFSQGLALVFNDKKGKFGYIDHAGKLVIDYKFDRANNFSDGFGLVSEVDEFGYTFIDSTGADVFHKKFFEAAPFQDSLAYVGKKRYNLP